MSTISPVRVIDAERLITGSCDTRETVTAHANAAVRTTFRMRLVIPLPFAPVKRSPHARQPEAHLDFGPSCCLYSAGIAAANDSSARARSDDRTCTRIP